MLKLYYVVGIILLIISHSSFGAHYFVNDSDLTGDIYTTSVGNDANTGTTPGSPKATLLTLLSTYAGSFTSNDTIFVDAGTYSTDANLSFDATLNGIHLVGAGSQFTFFDNNGASTDANRWANITGGGITIEGIYLTGYNYGFGGASALNINGATNLTIIDVQVNENTSGGGASAIVISGGSSVNFIGGGSNCNPAASSIAGGGVNVEGNGNTVNFTNYSITGNTKASQGGSGMRISGDNTTHVTITNSTISNNNNTSAEGGAAIYISGSQLTITGSCIEGNTTHSGSGPKYGGAITLARGATLNATNCNFANNSVDNTGKGGAISINTSFAGTGTTATATVTTCNFLNNIASSEGNHIYLRVGSGNAANVIINECTFSPTAEDVRQDNSGIVTVTNSGTAITLSGLNITNNNVLPSTVATPNCPIASVPCFSLLPVELIEFSAICKNGDAVVTWVTASEKNNDYFTLDRLHADGTFNALAQINGQGNSQEITSYSFIDKLAPDGMNYYRLTQVDVNGKREIYPLISLSSCSESTETRVMFDEANNQFIIKNSNRKMQLLSEASVTSLTGRTITQHQLQILDDSTATLRIPNQLAMGNYLIHLVYLDRIETVQLFVR